LLFRQKEEPSGTLKRRVLTSGNTYFSLHMPNDISQLTVGIDGNTNAGDNCGVFAAGHTS